MKIYDISQEVFGCVVFPGDPKPERQIMMQTANGDICNLTAFSMCAHNGTHVDAPYHFYGYGKTIDQVNLDKFIGYCFVVDHEGDVTADNAKAILAKAEAVNKDASKKILIKGKSTVTLEAAEVFANAKVDLIGNESQTVGPEDGPAAVHYSLLKEEIVLLEGIRLEEVPEGVYLLDAAPINLGGADGAPCRAVLIEL
ncbi:MAG: cyclase family protein [Saccharofermentans sp.]|nr:cyclase family protein [Saccharofermentans sp.]